MKIRTTVILFSFTFFTTKIFAQTVVVTDNSAYVTGQASSVLDVSSVSKGFLAPRMTTAQRIAISSPAEGLLVYQTDGVKGFNYYTNGAWTSLAGGGIPSMTTGSIPFAGAAGTLTQNNGSLFWDSTHNRLGVGTNGPASDFTLLQGTGGLNSRGMRFIGNALAGPNTGSGFSMSLAYNVANNKQFWMGDPDYLGNPAGTFIWYLTFNGSTILEAAAGDNTARRPLRLGVGGDPNSVVMLGDDGNSAVPGSFVWANGNMAIGNGYRANAAPTNGLVVQGNVGIGTTAPSTALHVVATTNPLTLIGVQTGAVSDSILTIASGTVRKLPFSTLTSGASWSLTGNAGTNYATNFLGTTDNTSLRFRTNNVMGMILDSLGNIGIGTAPAFTVGTNLEQLLVDAGVTNSVNAIVGKGTINNYLQLNIQNLSNGNSASSDVVATADNGTETVNYVDLGINSSTNTQNIFGAADDAYLYTTGNNFLIGTGTAAKALVFMTGGTTQSTDERMRIDGSGNVGVGKTSPAYKVDVHGRGNFDSTLNAPNYSSTFQTLTFGTTTTWDQTKGATAAVTLTGNATLSITNEVAGMYGLIRVTQDATGSRTLTLPGSSKVINGGGGAVALTTTAGATDVLSYFYDGTSYYWTVGYNYN
jgi:hypothetical protein